MSKRNTRVTAVYYDRNDVQTAISPKKTTYLSYEYVRHFFQISTTFYYNNNASIRFISIFPLSKIVRGWFKAEKITMVFWLYTCFSQASSPPQ